MPPLTKYEFVLKTDNTTKITIYAYSENNAIKELTKIVKDISIFKYK